MSLHLIFMCELIKVWMLQAHTRLKSNVIPTRLSAVRLQLMAMTLQGSLFRAYTIPTSSVMLSNLIVSISSGRLPYSEASYLVHFRRVKLVNQVSNLL